MTALRTIGLQDSWKYVGAGRTRVLACLLFLCFSMSGCGSRNSPTERLSPNGVATQHPLWIPVGPSNLPNTMFATPYTGSYRFLTADSAVSILKEASETRFDLLINLAGTRDNYQNPDGSFCLSCFKARLDQFAGINFTPFVIDGTVRGHVMFEDPENATAWNGHPVPFDQLDSAAAYSRLLFPTVTPGVNGPPSSLLPGAPWHYLRFGIAEYTTEKGSLASWRDSEVAAARSAGLGIVTALNVLEGDNGGPISVAEMRLWGRQLACEPYCMGILFWRYDPAYFSDPAVIQAVQSIVSLVKNGPAEGVECGHRED